MKALLVQFGRTRVSKTRCRIFAEVVLGMAIVVVLRMLDVGLGVDVALRSSASARAAGRSGGGAGRPTSKTFGVRSGHGCVEVEDAPQPPTWRAKCWRTVPGTGCFSRGMESSNGLNTESNNPQRALATWLVKIAGGEHGRDEHAVLPRFSALLER